MTLQTYTILYLNLVCEMIYVVAERLKTQQIPIDKSKLGRYFYKDSLVIITLAIWYTYFTWTCEINKFYNKLLI